MPFPRFGNPTSTLLLLHPLHACPQFCAIININLAAVNILPLPALDGGYMLLLLIEALRGGRKLPQDLEQGFQASGLLLLTAMGMGLVVRDTINLFH